MIVLNMLTLQEDLKMSNVLAFGCPHEPVSRPHAIRFCLDLQEEWSCDKIVIAGDVADHSAISFHANHPDCPGPKDEFELTHQAIQKWYKAFPNAKVCIGNHDARIIRLAESVNIPSRFIRSFSSIFDTPKWTWDYEFIIDDVYYFHGTGNGGMHPAYNVAKKMLMSVVMSHIHTAAGIKWLASPRKRTFGMDLGCLIDDSAMQFAYGRHMRQRSIIGAGVVLGGKRPYHEIMPIGPGEEYKR